jgi:hypothetical protein
MQNQGFLSLTIGQVPVELRFLDPELREAALDRYAAFAHGRRSGAARGALPIHLEPTPRPPAPSADFHYTHEGAHVWLKGTAAHFSGVRSEYTLDSLLRILFSWVLLPREGFLLHAATVVRSGRAYVFPGRSGAGKSTLASFSPPGSVLTDEISLLRREENIWRAYGTPFWGEFRAAGSNCSAPIQGIFSLAKSGKNALRVLAPRAALCAILPCVLFFSSDAEANKRLLDLLVGTVAEVPCYELQFRRDASYWDALPAAPSRQSHPGKAGAQEAHSR